MTDIKNKIGTGDVLLVHNPGKFLPEAIGAFQKCKWHHAGIFILLSGKIYISEADKYGLRFTDFDEYLNSNKHLLLLKDKEGWTLSEQQSLVNFVVSRTGAIPYDYFSLLIYQPIKFLAKWILHKEIWLQKEKNAGKRFSCGEWVLSLYFHFKGIFDDWAKGAPVDLYDSEVFTHERIQ